MRERLIPLVLAAFACLPLASSADQDAQARFENSLRNAKSLSNVEVHWRDTLWIKELDLKAVNLQDFSRTMHYSFIASGPKFRATCKLISGTSTNITQLTEAAYDGKSYAEYSSKGSMVTSSRKEPGSNSETPHNPIIAPFMFLTKLSDDCRKCVLRFTDLTSEGFANGVTLARGQKADGLLELQMPGLPLGKQPTTWTIAMDEDGGSFTPRTIKFIAPGSKYEVVHRFLEYTNLGAYQFPSRVEWTMCSYPPTSPPTVLSTGTVTLVSAHIPDQIADSVFKLDENAAAVVWDSDQRKLTKTSPELVKVKTATRTARIVLLVVMFMTVVALIVVAKRFVSRKG